MRKVIFLEDGWQKSGELYEWANPLYPLVHSIHTRSVNLLWQNFFAQFRELVYLCIFETQSLGQNFLRLHVAEILDKFHFPVLIGEDRTEFYAIVPFKQTNCPLLRNKPKGIYWWWEVVDSEIFAKASQFYRIISVFLQNRVPSTIKQFTTNHHINSPIYRRILSSYEWSGMWEKIPH